MTEPTAAAAEFSTLIPIGPDRLVSLSRRGSQLEVRLWHFNDSTGLSPTEHCYLGLSTDQGEQPQIILQALEDALTVQDHFRALAGATSGLASIAEVLSESMEPQPLTQEQRATVYRLGTWSAQHLANIRRLQVMRGES